MAAALLAVWADNVPSVVPGGSGDPGEVGLHAGLDDVDFSQAAVVVCSGGQSVDGLVTEYRRTD